VLQQQTLKGLQEVIKPPAPSPSSAPASSRVAKAFGDPPGSKGHTFYDHFVTDGDRDAPRKKNAYVQLLRKQLHVCNAVMSFAELARQRSPFPRVLIYPSTWMEHKESQQKENKFTETSMRLLQLAAERYEVQLVPVEPMLEVGSGEFFQPDQHGIHGN